MQFLKKETKKLPKARCVVIVTFEDPLGTNPEFLEVSLAFSGAKTPEFYVRLLEKAKRELLSLDNR